VVITYRRFGTTYRSHLKGSRIQRIPTTRCITVQKSAVLVHFAAEARNQTERPSCWLTSLPDRCKWFWQDILVCRLLSCKYVLLCLWEMSAICSSRFNVFARYLRLCNMNWNWCTGQWVTQALLLYHRILCSSSLTNASKCGVCVKEDRIMNAYVEMQYGHYVCCTSCLLFTSRLKENIFSAYCQRW